MNERGPCCQSEIRDRYSPVKRLLSYTLYFFSYSVTKCKVLVVARERERERNEYAIPNKLSAMMISYIRPVLLAVFLSNEYIWKQILAY